MTKPDPDLEKLFKQLFPHYPDKTQIAEFFEAVGIAMSAWQLVEEGLYHIFERSVAPGRPGAAGCGFHALQFSGKLLVADAAVRFALLSFPPAKRAGLTTEWDGLFKKARHKAQRRNDFAHFVTMSYFSEPRKDRQVLLQPAAFDFRFAAGLIKKREYTVNDIKVNAEKFRELAKAVTQFAGKIPPPK